jgi:hypothetical protein
MAQWRHCASGCSVQCSVSHYHRVDHDGLGEVGMCACCVFKIQYCAWSTWTYFLALSPQANYTD